MIHENALKTCKHGMTAAEFASKSEVFRAACEMAETKPTKRQARKWRQRRGLAWETRKAVAA